MVFNSLVFAVLFLRLLFLTFTPELYRKQINIFMIETIDVVNMKLTWTNLTLISHKDKYFLTWTGVNCSHYDDDYLISQITRKMIIQSLSQKYIKVHLNRFEKDGNLFKFKKKRIENQTFLWKKMKKRYELSRSLVQTRNMIKMCVRASSRTDRQTTMK